MNKYVDFDCEPEAIAHEKAEAPRRFGGRQVVATLRIDGIKDDMSPRQLREMLEEFGDVGDVSIHAGEGLVYGLAEMSREDAHEVIEAVDDAKWRAQWNFREACGRGPSLPLNSRPAPRAPGSRMNGFLPHCDGERKTETESSGFAVLNHDESP